MKNYFKIIVVSFLVFVIFGITIVCANQAIQAMQNDQIKIKLNGEIQTFYDGTTGEVQYPITYNNRTYLPLRNVAELSGLTVDYDAANNMAILKSDWYVEPVEIIEEYPIEYPEETIIGNPEDVIEEPIIETQDTSDDLSDATIKEISKLISTLQEVPKGEVAKFATKLKGYNRFVLIANEDKYNSCTFENNHIIIGKEDTYEKNLPEVQTVMCMDLSLENTNAYDQYGGYAVQYLNNYSNSFGYEVFEFMGGSGDGAGSSTPKVVILKYSKYYTMFNVKKNKTRDDNAEYVVNANDYANFIAYIINHNDENIHLMFEDSKFFTSNKHVYMPMGARAAEKDNYKEKIDASKERVYTVAKVINGHTYEIPQINVDNENVVKKNNTIIEDVTKIIEAKKYNEYKIEYRYYIFQDMLDVIIETIGDGRGISCDVYNVSMIGGNLLAIGKIGTGKDAKNKCLEAISSNYSRLQEKFGEYNYTYGESYSNEEEDSTILNSKVYLDESNRVHVLLRSPISGRYIDSIMIDSWLRSGISVK